MKKNYSRPLLKVASVKLTTQILDLSNGEQGNIGGGGEGNPDGPVL